MTKIIGIIPARYASTRFPGKPLVKLGSLSMIERVYRQAEKCKSLHHVLVATDDERIAQEVARFGGSYCMTDPNHVSGTDRCREAMEQTTETFDYVVNIQGDEPFIAPEQIEELCQLLDGNTELATQARQIQQSEDLLNPNVVKLVKGNLGHALYFSRQAIPYYRGLAPEEWLSKQAYYQHIGLYAYRTDVLKRIAVLPPSTLEIAESLEQLRWL